MVIKMIKKHKLFIFLILFTLFFQDSGLYSINQSFKEGLETHQKKHLSSLNIQRQIEFEDFSNLISKSLITNTPKFYHILQEVNYDKGLIILEDQSEWKINWWYTKAIKNWKPGDRLKIFYFNGFLSNFKIENVDQPSFTWGDIQTSPNQTETLARISIQTTDGETKRQVVLDSGWVFQGSKNLAEGWKPKEEIFILHNKSDTKTYDLWNLSTGKLANGWDLIENEKGPVTFNNILKLEKNLNKRVLAQKVATKTLADTMVSYYAGLKDPQTPIGVFLFLGPTGVGKTELAKALTDELYKTQSRMIRFDMSHFSESHKGSALIGAPFGYVNHKDGGQLTNPLIAQPQSVVLLDEIEKAHPEVRKIFLPIFDEGHLFDNKHVKVDATQAIFIMTSNIASTQIVKLFDQGYNEEEILKRIEPTLMETLSPELYNRVEPIVFNPLDQEAINELVAMMLNAVCKQVKAVKNIDLKFDTSVKEYLAINGYHPLLGARPLKRLIQKKVVANLSYAIVGEEIPNGAAVTLMYFPEDDSWQVVWEC